MHDVIQILEGLNEDTEESWARLRSWAARRGLWKLGDVANTELQRCSVRDNGSAWSQRLARAGGSVWVGAQEWEWRGFLSPTAKAVVHLVRDPDPQAFFQRTFCDTIYAQYGDISTTHPPCVSCINRLQTYSYAEVEADIEALRGLRHVRLAQREEKRLQETQGRKG